MGDPLKPDGRKVKEYASDISQDITELIKILTGPMGETDPVKYQKAMKAGIRLAERMGTTANEIVFICKVAAMRGAYGEEDDDS